MFYWHLGRFLKEGFVQIILREIYIYLKRGNTTTTESIYYILGKHRIKFYWTVIK